MPRPADRPEPMPHQITGLLREAAEGQAGAFNELLPLVYDQLNRIARGRLRRESPGHTLETAALVHEAWLRLIRQHRVVWQDRHHFFAVASEAMRRVLVDYAKRRRADKRGGASVHVPLNEAEELAAPGMSADPDEAILALDDALNRLERFSADGARVVQYRFFAGLSNQEVAELLGTSERTVRRSWTAARAWLRRDLLSRHPGPPRTGR
ncbi:MAG: ECF-type sigma factor [Gemmatimonadales bacterium]